MDLIDRDDVRQELVKAMERTLAMIRGTGKADASVMMALQYAVAKLDSAETVDAEPVRHGKWKKIKGAINCSACKNCSWSTSFEELVSSFNYCPNCGAKMDAEQEKQNE